ncbi:butyrate kinase [bacterium]|nr:butyrate kinase [bacterium]
MKILAINPGSTSTKVALYNNDQMQWNDSIDYSREELEGFDTVLDQLELRRRDIEKILIQRNTSVSSLDAVVGRGGPFKALTGGTYIVNDVIISDIVEGRVQAEHISNIGSLLASDFALKADAPAYFVDPVSVDEFGPLAHYSGLPELPRRSLVHALNVKATARKAADKIGKPLDELNMVVAHLGGGISICPLEKGRIVDVNNANDSGPFSPERAGSLPVTGLMKLCFSGRYTLAELKKKVVGNGGLVAYLGVNDGRKVREMIEAGDKKAKEVFEALAYQIAKEIGAMGTVLKGNIDAIVLTGGMAHNDMLMGWVSERISFLAPIFYYPGENELEALALGALRVLKGEEEPKTYK